MAKKQIAPTEITRGTLEVLLDLVEIKLGCVEIYDRDDARELKTLERARAELSHLLGREQPPPVVPLPSQRTPRRVTTL